MELVLIPSLTAILIKVAIFLRYSASLTRENLNLGLFFLSIFFLNIAELLAIGTEFAPDLSLNILTAYYCCAFFTLHAFINLAIDQSGFNWYLKPLRTILNLALGVMVLLTLVGDLVLAGASPTENSLTAINGPLYFLVRIYLPLGVIFACGLLIWGSFAHSSRLQRQRCLVIFAATLAPALTVVSVVTLMAMGAQINAAVVLSLAFTITLLALVYTEEKTRLFHLLAMLPDTQERRLHNRLLAQLSDCMSPDAGNVDLKNLIKEFEAAVVEQVLAFNEGNQKKTAHALGVSEAAISRRLRQHSKPASTENRL